MATIDVAYLGGTMLQMETIEDSFEKAIARYEFPYVDGADLEDMGQKARAIRIRCYFWDDGAENNSYDDHHALLDLLNGRDLLEFEHPKYGVLQVMIEQVSARHDDRVRAAEIDLTLVQQLRVERPPAGREDVQAVVEGAFATSQEEQQESCANATRTALGVAGDDVLGRVLDPAQGILEQFRDVSRTARAYIKQVDVFVSGIEAELIDIANPANGLVSAIEFGTGLPGRIVGAVARCAERYALLYDSLTVAPHRFFDSYRLAADSLVDRFGFPERIRPAFAAQASLCAARIYRGDEARRAKLRIAEQSRSFDVLGRYVAPADPGSVMTVNELESTLAVARQMIQAGVDLDRETTALKAMGRSLLEHVGDIKLEREKIVRVLLDNPMPLHLVCLRYGLPYNYAERIYSINSIRHPNFTSGEVAVYVR